MSRLRLVLWPLLLVAFASSIYLARIHTEMVDFEVYRTAAVRAIDAEPLYRVDDAHYQYKYLPAFAFAMYPFAAIDHRVARLVWFALSFGLVCGYVRRAAWAVPARRLSAAALIGFAVLLVGKYYVRELNLGQTNILLAVVLLGALLAAEGGRKTLAGVCVALGVFVKPYALILLPWLWLTSGVAGMAGLIVTLGAGLAAPALAYGWSDNLAQIHGWYRTVTDTSAPNLLVPENISLATMWAKWLGVDADTAFRYGSLTAGALLLLAAAVLARRRQVREPAYLEFGLLLALVPLISPQGWDYVLLIATPAFLIVVDRWKETTWPWRLTSGAAIAGISFTIFDLIGRTLYTAAMRYSVISVAAVLLIVSLANLRFRRLA